ncbi:MAG: hypothetical protein ABMB14_35825 [Myxococcota bacterium]
MTGPPALSFAEQDRLDAIRAAWAAVVPIAVAGWSLSGGPEAVGWDDTWWYADLSLVCPSGGPTPVAAARDGTPSREDGRIALAERTETDLDAIRVRFAAFAVAVGRILADAQDPRFGPPPWLGVVHLDRAIRAAIDAPPTVARSIDATARRILADPTIARFLAPSIADEQAIRARLEPWLVDHETVFSSDDLAVALVTEPRFARDGVWLTVRLIEYAGGQVASIFEQDVRIAPTTALDDPDRLMACLDGWVEALPRRAGIPAYDWLPVYDDRVLALAKPQTPAAFADAFARRWKVL